MHHFFFMLVYKTVNKLLYILRTHLKMVILQSTLYTFFRNTINNRRDRCDRMILGFIEGIVVIV